MAGAQEGKTWTLAHAAAGRKVGVIVIVIVIIIWEFVFSCQIQVVVFALEKFTFWGVNVSVIWATTIYLMRYHKGKMVAL